MSTSTETTEITPARQKHPARVRPVSRETIMQHLTKIMSGLYEDDNKGYNHYMHKGEITRSIVEGVKGRALCGTRFPVRSHGGGRPWSAELPTCELCAFLAAYGLAVE